MYFSRSSRSPRFPFQLKSRFQLTALFLLSIMLCLAGCSSLAEKESPAAGIPDTNVLTTPGHNSGPTAAPSDSDPEDKTAVYVPTFLPLPKAVSLNDSDPIGDNRLYFSIYDFDSETGQSRHLPCVMDLTTLEVSSLNLPLQEQDSLSQIALRDDGGFALLVSHSVEDASSFVLILTDDTGQEILRHDVTDAIYVESPLDDTGGSPQCMNTDSQGNLYIIVHSGYDSELIVLDSQGEKLFSLDADECSGLYRGPEGAVYTLIDDSTASASSRLTMIDLKAEDFGASFKGIPGTGFHHIDSDSGHTFLISSGNTLYAYDTDTQTAERLLQWTDCNIDSDTIDRLTLLPDRRILVFTRTIRNNEWYSEAVYLTLTPRSQITEKIVVTYGTLYLDRDIAAQIVAFNKANDSYRIEVKEYGDGDEENGLLQLNADIISGNSPDILSLSYGIDAENYISKGVLTDLMPFLTEDPELKPDDFIPSVLKYYSRDEKIYGVPLFFQIQTLIGRTADVGSRAGWTLEDVMTVAGSLPDETALIYDGSQESVLQYMLTAGISTYIDQDTGICHFDGEEFIRLLEFVNLFPAKKDLVRSYQTYTDLSLNRALLLPWHINTVLSYQYAQALFQGDPITCVGYPTSQGSGSLILPYDSFGISSQSLHPEGAWAFLRTLLTHTFQYETVCHSTVFPLRKDTLETLFQDEMNLEPYRMSEIGQSDFTYHQETVTPEVTDALRQIIDTAQSSLGFDSTVYNIILEEAAPYFAGQKTAAEAARVIQGRLQIYVSENQ